jgi:hypothetical protein
MFSQKLRLLEGWLLQSNSPGGASPGSTAYIVTVAFAVIPEEYPGHGFFGDHLIRSGEIVIMVSLFLTPSSIAVYSLSIIIIVEPSA